MIRWLWWCWGKGVVVVGFLASVRLGHDLPRRTAAANAGRRLSPPAAAASSDVGVFLQFAAGLSPQRRCPSLWRYFPRLGSDLGAKRRSFVWLPWWDLVMWIKYYAVWKQNDNLCFLCVLCGVIDEMIKFLLPWWGLLYGYVGGIWWYEWNIT